jgi:hypothetical protein
MKSELPIFLERIKGEIKQFDEIIISSDSGDAGSNDL